MENNVCIYGLKCPEKNIGGIYIIRNTINDKVYIGSAMSFNNRFNGHKSDLNNGKHNNRLQNFVNKYGIETLIFDVIEIIENKENLIEREQYWIDYYQSYKSKNGYNISKTAGSTLGCKMPQSHKDACSKRMKGNKLRVGIKLTEQEKKEIGDRSKLFWKNNPEKLKNAIIKSSQKRKGKPQWVDKPHPLLGKEHPAKGQKRSKEFCELMRKQRLEKNGMKGSGRPIDLIDDYGNVLREYKSIKDATNELGLNKGAVVRVCKGEYKQTKGYKFRYASSKLCECGTINNDLKLSDRIWTCKACGRVNNRDELASRNIKNFGLKRQNLIGLSPAVSGAEGVELSAVVEAKKCQYI